LKWKANKSRRVLHIDGEIPAVALREERLKPIIAAHEEQLPDTNYFRILPADAYDLGLANLALATMDGSSSLSSF
jgi:hypothetical protein